MEEENAVRAEAAARLARALGHLRYVRRMVERNQDCAEVLIQLAAVNGALSGVTNLLLNALLDDALAAPAETADEFRRVINWLLK